MYFMYNCSCNPLLHTILGQLSKLHTWGEKKLMSRVQEVDKFRLEMSVSNLCRMNVSRLRRLRRQWRHQSDANYKWSKSFGRRHRQDVARWLKKTDSWFLSPELWPPNQMLVGLDSPLSQCDQMDILFVQFLANLCSEKLPNRNIFCIVVSKIFPITKLSLKKGPKNYQNFVKSGKTLPNLAALLPVAHVIKQLRT